MVHYIRFLKTPKTQTLYTRNAMIKSLITITNDLGDDFYQGDLTLEAEILTIGTEKGGPLVRKQFTWTYGMRTLWIVMEGIPLDVCWPVQLHIYDSNPLVGTPLMENVPDILSAWSEGFDMYSNMEAGGRVERRLRLSSDNMLSIFEDPGESIARHVWDAGVALLAYMRNLQQHPDRRSLQSLGKLLYASRTAHLKVLELGSGCGIVGIGLAQLYPNCDVLATDLPEAMEILGCNIAQARPAPESKLSKANLNWDDDLPTSVAEEQYHLILVSDCTYNSDSIPALVGTLRVLIKRSPRASIVVSMKVRHSSEAIFFDMMKDAGLTVDAEATFPLPDRRRSAIRQELETVDIYIFQKARSLANQSSGA